MVVSTVKMLDELLTRFGFFLSFVLFKNLTRIYMIRILKKCTFRICKISPIIVSQFYYYV